MENFQFACGKVNFVAVDSARMLSGASLPRRCHRKRYVKRVGDVWLKICRLRTQPFPLPACPMNACMCVCVCTNAIDGMARLAVAEAEEWYQNGNVYWYGIHFVYEQSCNMFYVQTFILLSSVVVIVVLEPNVWHSCAYTYIDCAAMNPSEAVWTCVNSSYTQDHMNCMQHRRHRNGNVPFRRYICFVHTITFASTSTAFLCSFFFCSLSVFIAVDSAASSCSSSPFICTSLTCPLLPRSRCHSSPLSCHRIVHRIFSLFVRSGSQQPGIWFGSRTASVGMPAFDLFAHCIR